MDLTQLSEQVNVSLIFRARIIGAATQYKLDFILSIVIALIFTRLFEHLKSFNRDY